ncbi:MAG: DUF3530 family protein [Gammaproteobacteria bacterium]|nr:DUF3530 family protein [Gammaproteobacteria bacterium]
MFYEYLKKPIITSALLLVSFFSLAQAETPDQAASLAINASVFEQNFANSHSISATEVRWLTLDSGKFLALQRHYLSATHRGTAILVADRHSTPTNSNGINQLRIGLNEHGWDTLALMPPINVTNVASTDDATEPETPAAAPTSLSYQQQLLARLQSAYQVASLTKMDLIVIAQGSQASYITKFYLDQVLRLPDAFIVLDARPEYWAKQESSDEAPIATSQALFSEQISQLDLHILDIYRLQNNLSEHMVLRKKLSIKNHQYTYRQSELYDSDNSHQLVKTVYGWLKSAGLN